MKFRIFLFALMATALSFSACKKDDETEEENITTIEVHLTGADFDRKFYWKDTDGDDVANSIDTIKLPALRSGIQCHIHVYDESQSPLVDLTEEIEEESAEHLFTYAVSGANITINNTNKDSEGKEFGITSVWTTAAASTGSVNIKLYHQPTDKGNLGNPGGEVDFNVTFPAVLK